MTITEEMTENGLPVWTVKLCKMPPTQRLSYERACYFLRGLPSLTGVRQESSRSEIHGAVLSDSHVSTAKALVQLRRECFLSGLPNSKSTLEIQALAHRDSFFPFPEKVMDGVVALSQTQYLKAFLLKDQVNYVSYQTFCGRNVVMRAT